MLPACHDRVMATVLLILVVVLVLAALVFGVVSLLSGSDPGLGAVEPDGRAVSLPNNRSLTETDLKTVRFDLGWRGYRMAQVDRVLRRTAYDVGYKDEMIAVLEAEVLALREGRSDDAELLRTARESAANPSTTADAATTLDAPASWDGDLPAEDSTTSGSADSQAATRDQAVLAEHRGRPDGGADGAAVADRAVDKEAAAASAAVEADEEASDQGPADEEAPRHEAARREAATPGRLADRSGGRAASSGTSSGQADSRSPHGTDRAASNGHTSAGPDSNVQASGGPDNHGSANSANSASNSPANSASNSPAKAPGNGPAASGNGPATASGDGGGQERAEPSTDRPARA
jgi:DivIVA domain-containing protein